MFKIITMPECILSRQEYESETIGQLCFDVAKDHAHYWTDRQKFARQLVKGFAALRKAKAKRGWIKTEWRGIVVLAQD